MLCQIFDRQYRQAQQQDLLKWRFTAAIHDLRFTIYYGLFLLPYKR